MADFGVRDFLLRRSAGSARLQADAGRAVEASRAFEGRMFWSSNIICGGRSRRRQDFEHRCAARVVLVTEAPPEPISRARSAGRNFATRASRPSCRATRSDAACIVYSSGTGGRPKGCVLTHENYLEQCVALTSLYPFLARRALPEHSADEPRHRFHGAASSGRSPAARRWSICARCGRNTFAKRSRDTRSPT